ncbi:MAG TPA: hypothetical protein VFZ00_22595 [Solirubrobacter sp.]|jgi:hypothetical protein|nr:hypothetical protein [Solirubrobacter sp.]
MFYELLGRMVWKGLKAFLRLKYGRFYLPKPVLAGGTVAIALAVMAVVQRFRSSDT